MALKYNNLSYYIHYVHYYKLNEFVIMNLFI